MNVSEINLNEIYKPRLVTSENESQSRARKEWFATFEEKLRKENSSLLNKVIIEIVGSTAENVASSSSDIDIIIRTGSSDELLIPLIRRAIFSLLNKMKENGEKTYKIDIQEVGNPLMFSQVAMFKRENNK